MTSNIKKHSGACHCHAVEFVVQLVDEFNTIRRCSCSYCAMRGAVAVSARLDDINITKGEAMLSLYQFNTNTAQHYFCRVCGIYTHHRRRSNPDEFGINVACLEGISPFDFPEINVTDGINHPNDSASGPLIAGVLRYTKA